ncbi:hypothetical protein TSAR_012754, partial [Trichomalopsis sarcophagae]
ILLSLVSTVLGVPQWYGGPAPYGPHGAAAPLGPDGRVIDTPEKSLRSQSTNSKISSILSGPPAPLGPDGRVIDTPEVQQAKAVHFSLYNAEVQKAGPTGPVGPAPGAWGNPAWNEGGWNGGHDYY